VPKAKRRTVLLAATACAGVLVIVLLVTGFGNGGSGNGVTFIDGSTSAVYYASGHRAMAPDFSGSTLTGAPLRFASYRSGKVVVLNFWGSWCDACRAEEPTLAVLSEQYQSAGVAFLGVDVRDTTVSALAFVHSSDIPYPSVSDPDDLITLDFTSVVPIAATPTTLVVDRTGHIAGAVFGATTYSELTTILNKVTGKS
jgi:thiol-disulfide isomerase/thioredoxin